MMLKLIKPHLFWILLLFLTAGFFYPALGLVAIICMLGPVLLAPWLGRYWCGNICPRGSFYERVITHISPRKTIPPFWRSKALRLFMLATLITVFSVQMYYAWGDLSAMGLVFLRIILITTLIGVVLALVYHPRTWCSFCPMGTMASWFSGRARPLAVEATCVNCKLCTKACPFGLTPYSGKASGSYNHPDCLKCDKCVAVCPKDALCFSRPDAATNRTISS